VEYISYSQYNSYTRCPRSWYLTKVRKAEEKQTWYIPIGSAVHTAIEQHLDGCDPNLEGIFYDLISRQMSTEPDMSKWLFGGSAEAPIVEDKALKRVVDCYNNAVEFLEDVEVFEVEYDASGKLPGLDIPIKGYVDIIGEHKKYGQVIIDWKTGSQKPKDNFQLETYKALLMQGPYAPEPFMYDKGLWGMLSPLSSKARPVDLSQVSPKDIGEKYQAVYEQMSKKIYKTNAGYNCRFCFNQDNCMLEAGPTARAKFYDRADQDGYPY